MRFCQRCFDKIKKEWLKKAASDPKCVLDVNSLKFPCQIPLHEHDPLSGEALVKVWNCKTEKFDIYSVKDYNDKVSRGEL